MSIWPDEDGEGTLISSPDTGILYFSIHRYRDGAAAFRERRGEFRIILASDPYLARLRARLAAMEYDLPQSPGEYVELESPS